MITHKRMGLNDSSGRMLVAVIIGVILVILLSGGLLGFLLTKR